MGASIIVDSDSRTWCSSNDVPQGKRITEVLAGGRGSACQMACGRTVMGRWLGGAGKVPVGNLQQARPEGTVMSVTSGSARFVTLGPNQPQVGLSTTWEP